MSRMFDAFGDWDWTNDVAEYSNPVLIIHGTADPVPIEGAQEWVQSFPNARLFRVEGAGHLPWLEQSEVVIEAITTFLSGNWPGGSIGHDQPTATNAESEGR